MKSVGPAVLLRSLLQKNAVTSGTTILSYLIPLWDFAGTTAGECSGNYPSKKGAYSGGVTLTKKTGLANILLMCGFDGSSAKITLNSNCTVKGQTNYTFMAVLNVVRSATEQVIYYEPTADDIDVARMQISITPEGYLKFIIRTGLSTQTPVTITSNTALATGIQMLHITLSLYLPGSWAWSDGRYSFYFYINGELFMSGVSASGGCVWTGCTATEGTYLDHYSFANTAPACASTIGCKNDSSPSLFYAGDMAMVAGWLKKLDVADILHHAKAGGLA